MKEIKLFDYQEDMKERIEKALRLHRSVMAQMPTGTGKTVLLASVVESFLREHSNCNVWIVAHRRELVSQIRETIERIFSKTHPSSLTLKGGSTAFPKPLSPQGTGDVTALRCSEPLRSKVGGPSKVSPDCLSAGALKGTSDCLSDCLSAGASEEALSSSDLSSLISTSIKVTSIQWLSRHYGEMEEKPGLIVIDEAHHALAETYAEVMNAYPKAKKLGLTCGTGCGLPISHKV